MNNIKMLGYALVQIIDSLVIICTLGFVATSIPFNYILWWEKKELKKKLNDTSHE